MDALLTSQQINDDLADLNLAWAAIGNDYLVRTFETNDFSQGAALVQKIADIANGLNHHPDIRLTYPSVEVRLSTHDVNGITAKDIELAAAIDKIEL